MANSNTARHPGNFKDRAGQRYGLLVVLEYAGPTKSGKVLWRCLCDCGKETLAQGSNLVTGHTTSCGCRVRPHGHSYVAGKRSPTYESWRSMIERCIRPGNASFPAYGGAGIAVCERWRQFTAFLEDMGERPSPAHSIDRIENDRGYERGNCRWATDHEQAQNMRRNKMTPGLVRDLRRHVLAGGVVRSWAKANSVNLSTAFDAASGRAWPNIV